MNIIFFLSVLYIAVVNTLHIKKVHNSNFLDQQLTIGKLVESATIKKNCCINILNKIIGNNMHLKMLNAFLKMQFIMKNHIKK